MVCDVEIVLYLTSQTPVCDNAIITIGVAVELSQSNSRARVINHKVISFTISAI